MRSSSSVHGTSCFTITVIFGFEGSARLKVFCGRNVYFGNRENDYKYRRICKGYEKRGSIGANSPAPSPSRAEDDDAGRERSSNDVPEHG